MRPRNIGGFKPPTASSSNGLFLRTGLFQGVELPRREEAQSLGGTTCPGDARHRRPRLGCGHVRRPGVQSSEQAPRRTAEEGE